MVKLFSEKKKSLEIAENWAAYISDRLGDHPAYIRVNLSLQEIAPIKDYDVSLQLTLQLLTVDENGFPKPGEREALDMIQEKILEKIPGNENEILFVGISIFNGLLDLYFYTKKGEKYKDIFTAIMYSYPVYEYGINLYEEKEWNTFFTDLVPTDYELRTIDNQSLLSLLSKDGDDPRKEREVIHQIYFSTDEGREQFIRKAEELGYKVGTKDTIDYDSVRPFRLYISRQDNIESANVHAYTWELVKLADTFEGEYDGWGCTPVKAKVN